MVTKKITRSVTGQKIKTERELIRNVTLNEKMLQLRLNEKYNKLFGTDWMENFKLWNSPISSFCQKIKGFTNEAESLKKE